MMDPSWETTLGAFERHVAAQWSALERGDAAAITPFQAPAFTASLPPELLSRATELVWRCRALEDALSQALSKAQDQLDQLAAAPAHPAEPVYFDSRV